MTSRVLFGLYSSFSEIMYSKTAVSGFMTRLGFFQLGETERNGFECRRNECPKNSWVIKFGAAARAEPENQGHRARRQNPEPENPGLSWALCDDHNMIPTIVMMLMITSCYEDHNTL